MEAQSLLRSIAPVPRADRSTTYPAGARADAPNDNDEDRDDDQRHDLELIAADNQRVDRVLSGLGAQSGADDAVAADREMAAGSHAARREASQEAAAGRSERRASFQEALREAQRPAPAKADHAAAPAKDAKPAGQQPPGPAKPPAEAPPTAPKSANADAGKPGNASQPVTPGAASKPPPTPVPPTAAPQAQTSAGAALATTGVAAQAAGGASSGGRPSAGATGVQSAQPTRGSGAAPAASSTPGVNARNAPAGAKSAAPADKPAQERPEVERIVRMVRQSIREGNVRSTMRIESRELGAIRVQMDLRDDVLRLRVDTQSESARRLLSDDLDGLRRGLEAAGLRLERFEAVGPPTEQSADRGADRDGAGQSPGRRDEARGEAGAFAEEARERLAADDGDRRAPERERLSAVGRRRGRASHVEAASEVSPGAMRDEHTQSSETLLNILA